MSRESEANDAVVPAPTGKTLVLVACLRSTLL